MTEKLCRTCILWSTGINDPKGAGYCYSEGDYTSAVGRCDFWQVSLRDKPLDPPEVKLIQQVAELDNEEEG